MKNNTGNNNLLNNLDSSDRFIISYELLQLMEWMVEYECESLKKIIAKALKRGFDEQLKESKNMRDLYSAEEMQNNIIDFLGLLEVLLVETTNEQDVSQAIEKNLMPAIDHVDLNNCDSSTIKASVALATSKSQRNPKANIQELFLKELLKKWKPLKNGISN